MRVSPSRPTRLAPRAGFTLVELIVVIVIIGILAALILPAISRVFGTARTAQVVTEIRGLETAIAAFKAKYGVEPPSQITLCLTSTGWSQYPESRAAIQQIWPQFDFRDYNANPNVAGMKCPSWWATSFQNDAAGHKVFRLNSGECLAFFLGGVIPDAPSSGKTLGPLGFANNPRTPFDPAITSRVPPFFEFDNGRIRDTDGNGFPEYVDSLPGDQRKAYLYFSSYDGTGYRASEELYLNNNPVVGLRDVYRQGTAPLAPGLSTGQSGHPAQRLQPFKPQSFQIISAGVDNDYGLGGVYNPDLTNGGLTTNGSTPDRAGFDNITNFSSGTLVK
ncbi:MAG: prepilin-type N-terminal cleavage/methylation domain-containing protein [Planctomycetaceae bacterium]